MAEHLKRYLHSTMFLLKREPLRVVVPAQFLFTFHNVSIKTETSISVYSFISHLHSTMFLLKPLGLPTFLLAEILFTFHNVSIKTNLISVNLGYLFYDLHSTMFLLKP